MSSMEMQQLLDIPTGNEPAAELCRKLEAVEMMLKGFHGEISEVTEVLDVLVTLHHFLSDSFIRSKDPFVRLSTGNCLIQLWTLPGSGQRIANSDLQVLQSFLMSSVSLLKDPEADWYAMSLEHVRSLQRSKALCFVRFIDDLEFVVDWSSNLFSRVFTVVKKTTAVAINQLQLLLQTVVSDLVQVNEVEPVLDVIYAQILDHAENPTAFEFSVKLLRACRRDLELPTQQFFVNHLQSKPSSADLGIVFRKFELMKTLYCACPQLVATAVGGLQNCLEATTLDESSVDLVLMLSKMFAVTGSNLARDCRHLWFSFLRSLRHGDRQVQLLGLGEMTNIICNHPELLPICWKYFMAHCVREGSPDVVQNVFDCLETASCSFNISLIDCIVQVMKEMVSDSSVGLTERALKVLAVILEKLLFSPMNTNLTQKCIEIMSIFSNYYQFGDNRAKSFTQKLFLGYLIPFALPAEERVLRLLNFWLFMPQDMRALFHDIQRNSFFFRKRVHEALKLCEERDDDSTTSLLLAHVVWVSERLDRPDSRQDYLALEELFLRLGRNRSYLGKLKIIADQASCSIDHRVSAMNELLDTLKTRKKDMVPVVDQLCTKLMVNYFDKNSFNILLQWVHHCIINKQTPIRISYTPHEMAMEGLKLIFELLFSSPHLAFDSSSVTKLMEMLEATSSPGVSYTAMVLKVLAVTSMHKSFKTEYPELFDEHLLPLLKMYVVSGTPEESKYAVQTIAYHLGSERLGTLQKLLMEVFEKAKLQDDHYLTLISTAAYLNAFMPWDAAVSFRKILPQFYKIVFSPQLLINLLFTKEAIARHKEAFVNGHSPLTKQVCVNRILQCSRLPNGDFYEKDEVPSCTKCLKAAVKTASGLITTMAHLAEDPHKSLNMKQRHCELLTLMCLNEMHSSLQAPLRDEDKACLRLTAGTALLKLCQWPSFWDAMPVESFVALSHLMMTT
ncbi:sister chromatid cohesion protein PDS5 homolog A-like isoform X2 [Bacillus rossius redtenbacheri]|uniref:sister chromatid cohesion protein PDS5 homolog A-like isoform X2 n=1 Tax=Bacillus rossius redtenbacheri TaxID=93214 RepID=UPI002FDE352F